MRYIELSAVVDVTQTEQAADVLRALSGGDVAIETPFKQRDLESDAEPVTGGHAVLHAYVREGAAAGVDALRAAFASAALAVEVYARAVDEADWAEAWKEHFHPQRFGRIVVVPSWRTYESRPDDVVLTLDPGMAFGTGQHETTRMCLEALDRRLPPGARVLDMGCGSGILAVAAAKLGAVHVRAGDIDPDCVRITRDNARANRCERVVEAMLVTPGAESWAGDAAYDVIVANIIARAIVDLAPAFARALAPRGRLVASGVIGEREREVCDALAAEGMRVEDVRAMGEWRCIEAVR